MTIHIVVASAIKYVLSLFFSVIMGNQSSCLIIDLSWNSMGLWIVLIGAGAAAVYYYRHRIRRTARKEIYRTNGGDMDVYKELWNGKFANSTKASYHLYVLLNCLISSPSSQKAAPSRQPCHSSHA